MLKIITDIDKLTEENYRRWVDNHTEKKTQQSTQRMSRQQKEPNTIFCFFIHTSQTAFKRSKRQRKTYNRKNRRQRSKQQRKIGIERNTRGGHKTEFQKMESDKVET